MCSLVFISWPLVDIGNNSELLTYLYDMYNFFYIIFYRKAENSDKGYMVVINIDGSNSNSKRHIDFTDILPDFPAEGILVAKTLDLDEEENQHNHPIEWDNLKLLNKYI